MIRLLMKNRLHSKFSGSRVLFLLSTIARHVCIILRPQTLTHPLSQPSYVIDYD